MKYPHLLSSGGNNKVVAISVTEAAKLFTGNTRSEIGSEAMKMKFANSVNGLAAKFIRLDFDETLQASRLVMERIYPVDFRAYESEKRKFWLEVFEDELKQLHKNGFVHRELRCYSSLEKLYFDNILFTNKGLRLVDAGKSVLKSQVGDKIYEKYVDTEMSESKAFRKYFLNR